MYITIFCLGVGGLLSAIFPEFHLEISLGILLPWLLTVIEIPLIKRTHAKNPQEVFSLLTKGFIIKMILYGAYLFIILTFYVSHQLPFVYNFAGSFIVLHGIEAFVLKSTVQP